jgi:hypothetical protein
MAGRAGDQRPMSPPYGNDLSYASRLFKVLWSHDSPEARRFVQEYELLRHRWHRLVKGIFAYRNEFFPLGALEDTERDLEILETDHRTQHYPNPRTLNREEQACLEWRTSIAAEASQEIYVNLDRPLERPHDLNSTQGSWKIWEEVSRFLGNWGDEPFRKANPNLKLKRWRRREIIVNYRGEVSKFCDSWGLAAWWAVPAIIQHHFYQGHDDSDVDQTIPPLSIYASAPFMPVALPITIMLPGASEKQFDSDKIRALNLAETTIIKGNGGPIRVIRTHFSLAERADWEKSIDSTCILFEWDGHRFLPHGVELPTAMESNSPHRVTPVAYLVDQCQQRLSRRLTKRQELSVRRQVAGQIREHRRSLGADGWTVLGVGDLDYVSTCVARLLLTPQVTWHDLTLDDKDGKNRYDDYQTIRRACLRFATLANLTLPKKQAGRRQGFRNTFDPVLR